LGHDPTIRKRTDTRGSSGHQRAIRCNYGPGLCCTRPWPQVTGRQVGLPRMPTPRRVNISQINPFDHDVQRRDLTTAYQTWSGHRNRSRRRHKELLAREHYFYSTTAQRAMQAGNPNDANNLQGNFWTRRRSNRAPLSIEQSVGPTASGSFLPSKGGCSYGEELQKLRQLAASTTESRNAHGQGRRGGGGFAQQGNQPAHRLRKRSTPAGTVVPKESPPFRRQPDAIRFYTGVIRPAVPTGAAHSCVRREWTMFGKYFQRSNAGNPWALEPDFPCPIVGKEYTCRRAFPCAEQPTDFWNGKRRFRRRRAKRITTLFTGNVYKTPTKPDKHLLPVTLNTRLRNRATRGWSVHARIRSGTGSADTLADVAAYYWKN